MINSTTIARPYAQAVFEQAVEEGDIARWSSLLGLLTVIASDPQMQALLNSPNVSEEQLLDVISGICGEQLSSTGMNFIRILVNTGRFRHVGRIASLFEEKWAQSEGRMDIGVTSAYPLEPEQEGGISGMMTKRLGKKINITS
ncbi:MAG: F0F1 ATP synthase subunit delta, partial [Gammaproteobacteria bacterium]